jgi:hypothetical protein
VDKDLERHHHSRTCWVFQLVGNYLLRRNQKSPLSSARTLLLRSSAIPCLHLRPLCISSVNPHNFTHTPPTRRRSSNTRQCIDGYRVSSDPTSCALPGQVAFSSSLPFSTYVLICNTLVCRMSCQQRTFRLFLPRNGLHGCCDNPRLKEKGIDMIPWDAPITLTRDGVSTKLVTRSPSVW